jgi:glycerophosphoryl diester phosphodiesterase
MLVALALGACGDDLDRPGLPPDPIPAEALCAPPQPRSGALGPLEDEVFVAHAGGSPLGLLQESPYSNTREAFEVSYRNGFRAFELDFVLLADGEVVVAHDFHEEFYGLEHGAFPELTRADVEGALWNDRYEVMFAEDAIDLLVAHPDVWLILDTKLGKHIEIAEVLLDLAPDDSVRDRMVPHLASEEHAVALAARYPFPERLIAVYRWIAGDGALLDAMDRLGIDGIMMFWDSRWSEVTQARMEAAGHHVWVHTPTEIPTIRALRERGVGIYSNGWIDCPPGS